MITCGVCSYVVYMTTFSFVSRHQLASVLRAPHVQRPCSNMHRSTLLDQGTKCLLAPLARGLSLRYLHSHVSCQELCCYLCRKRHILSAMGCVRWKLISMHEVDSMSLPLQDSVLRAPSVVVHPPPPSLEQFHHYLKRFGLHISRGKALL